jgi:acyl-coenzyme A thioesterase PaaI-like protein
VANSGAAGEPGRSSPPPAHGAAGGGPSPMDSRRAAIAELGDALRDLVEQGSATEVGEDVLREVAVQVRQAAEALGQRTRKRAEMPSADDLFAGYRMYNPVIGSGSGLAAPLLVELTPDGAVGRCTLGLAFEGPPSFAHGGVSAMLLDQLLGHAASAAGHPGMTGRLEIWYRAPVPLQTPLRLTAALGEVTGRRVRARGTITTEADPDAVLVEASGIFIGLRAEQAARLFGGVHPDATDPQVAHD